MTFVVGLVRKHCGMMGGAGMFCGLFRDFGR